MLSPAESLQPRGEISQGMSGMCLLSSQELVAPNQPVPGDFLHNLLTNKEQQLKNTPLRFKKRFVRSRELRGIVCDTLSFLLMLWLSGCSIPGKERGFGGGDCWATFSGGLQGSGERQPGTVPGPHPLITRLRDMQTGRTAQGLFAKAGFPPSGLLYLCETEIKHSTKRQQTH